MKHALFLVFVAISLFGTITETADVIRFTKLKRSYATGPLAFFTTILLMTLGCWYGVL